MSRRDKRRRFSQWLGELLAYPTRGAVGKAIQSRSILVEPLESRQLLAGDSFMALLGSANPGASLQNDAPQDFSGSLAAEGELVGEGEDAIDLVALAKALTDSGARFFGAAWCPFCTEQKELFEDGGKFLPFIEVTNPDRTPNQIAVNEGISDYPTWEFSDGTRLTGVQSLTTLAQRAGITTIPMSSTPSMAELSNVTVRLTSPLHIPIDAYDPNGNPLTITVTSSVPGAVSAEVLGGNRSLRLKTEGFGDMTFELFEDRAPVPSGRVIQLAQDGFYEDVIFHRVINNFVIQGGDPTGTGAGGSTLGNFDDQFHVELQHNATGMLSYAKSSDDTNDSQFFITEGPQRNLDFNHSVFGILTEGEAVREAISNTATNSSDRPINSVVIKSATVFSDTENGVVLLKALGTAGQTSTITVTVTDSEGNQTSRSFVATVAADTANGAPFLNPIPSVQTEANTPVTVTLTSQDAEGDTVIYSVQKVGTQDYGLSVNSSTGVVTVTPPTGFTGELQFRATVRQSTTATTTSQDDNQLVKLLVTQASAPTSVDLLANSDSGISDTDNITNAQTLNFSVAGTTSGATVEILSGGEVVGTATATGTTTTVIVNNVASLGQGSTSFTARQRINGQTSVQSPSLSVELDSTAPANLAAGSVPASAIINQLLSVDLDHGEEGQGVTYALLNAPTGMAINGSTGQLTWTPTSAQLGTQTFTIQLTDEAGNTTNQQLSINAIDEPQVRISLNTVDMAGQPITTIATGQTFKVQVVLHDLRAGSAATGVFATYLDLLFDSAVIEPIATNPINHIEPYLNDLSGSTSTPGLIDELGAFSERSSRLGSESRVLAEVTFTAKAAGNANLRTESPDDVGNDILLYDQTAKVAFTRVDFGASAFTVGANFEVANDAFNFDEDSSNNVMNVLSNDQVTGGAVLTISGVGTTSGGGTVTIATDGKSLNYTPVANFNGAETFTYTARNQEGVELTATVTVQVTDINDPPVALNDTFSVFRNSTQNVLEVLSNDSKGVDENSSETLSIASVSTGSAGGTIERGPSGLTVRYTPATGFQGTETFTYTLADSRGGTATGTVSVSVNLENPPPTPQNDTFTVVEDAAQAEFDVLANDTTNDPAETLSVSAVGTSANGSTVSVTSDGKKVNYRPAANFSGTEVITYTLRDSGGATATGQMTFVVTPVNDPPTAVDDSLTALSSSSTTNLDVLANDTNVDTGETLTITSFTQPPSGSGTLSLGTNSRSLIYTPPSSSFAGNFTFTYTIGDGNGLNDTATVTLDVRNFVPRNFSGNVFYSVNDSAAAFGGVELLLSGTDVTGATVNRETTVGVDGSYAFNGLAPGNYTLRREPLAFLNDSGGSVTIDSAATDGDMVSDFMVTGSLRAGFFDIRDFLGSTVGNNLTVAVNADGTSNWIASRGNWSELSSLDVALNSTTNRLNVDAVNKSNQRLSGNLTVGSSIRVSQIAQEGSMRLLRIRTGVDKVGLTASTASTSTQTAASGEGEGAASLQQTSLIAEGESSGVPAVETTPPTQSDASFSNGPSELLSPSQAIQRLLGSATASRVAAANALSASAVDQAMESVLPALQLRLSDSLQDALAADGEASAMATDQAVSQL